jgi:hypothetical protein
MTWREYKVTGRPDVYSKKEPTQKKERGREEVQIIVEASRKKHTTI